MPLYLLCLQYSPFVFWESIRNFSFEGKIKTYKLFRISIRNFSLGKKGSFKRAQKSVSFGGSIFWQSIRNFFLGLSLFFTVGICLVEWLMQFRLLKWCIIFFTSYLNIFITCSKKQSRMTQKQKLTSNISN